MDQIRTRVASVHLRRIIFVLIEGRMDFITIIDGDSVGLNSEQGRRADRLTELLTYFENEKRQLRMGESRAAQNDY